MIYLITAYHQVARLQLQLLHAVAALPRSHQTTNALDMLNAELLDLSKVGVINILIFCPEMDVFWMTGYAETLRSISCEIMIYNTIPSIQGHEVFSVTCRTRTLL